MTDQIKWVVNGRTRSWESKKCNYYITRTKSRDGEREYFKLSVIIKHDWRTEELRGNVYSTTDTSLYMAKKTAKHFLYNIEPKHPWIKKDG